MNGQAQALLNRSEFLKKKTDKYISVAQFYAGSGDAAPAFLQAIQAANGNPIDVSGQWTFSSALDASGYDVHFMGKASIDAATVSAAYPVTLGGTLGSSAALGADVAKGAAGIDCALSVQPGDIIKIVSTDLWSAERSYYYKGELQRVLSVSGGTIYLQGQLNDGYAAATTTVTKINAASVRVDNKIEINRQSDTKGAFLIQWAKDLAISRLSTIQARERGIYVKECLGGYVADGQTVASFPVGGSSNYGLVYDSCAEISTLRGNYHAGRHGIATGGTFPCRDLFFDGCFVDNDTASGSYALDSHANGERFTYRNVFTKNGAVLQSIDTDVVGGFYITRNQTNGIAFVPGRNAKYLRVRGAIIDASSAVNGRGVTLSMAVGGLTVGEFSVSDRTNITANNPIYHLPFATGGGTTVRLFKVNNNQIIVTGQSATCGIYIAPNTLDPVIDLLSITGNDMKGASGPVSFLYANTNTQDSLGIVEFMDNTTDGNVTSGSQDHIYVNKAKLAKVHRNTAKGAGNSLRYELANCTKADCRNNDFSGFTSVGGLYLNNNTTNIAINNTTDGTFSFPANTIIGYTTNGKRIVQGAAVPTSGAWVVGDICINSSPAAGSAAGWECVTAGSPGTWRETGTISGAVTVATLRSASTAGVGARSFVSDANATTFNSIVAGGGANNVPVFSDGTNWRIG